MRALVIGGNGQLGTEVCKAFADVDLHETRIESFDVRDADAVDRLIAKELRPDVVVNTVS